MTYQINPGERPGEFIARIVRDMAGCSLVHDFAKLTAFVGAAEVDPNHAAFAARLSTNCATFSLGVLRAAGVKHPLLSKPLAVGMAFSWLVQVGDDLGAWRTPTPGQTIPVGACLWYCVMGTNDDHAEWCLSEPDAAGLVDHGGGGRPQNAITVGHGDIHTSWSRPIHRYLDPDALGIVTVPIEEPAPHPGEIEAGAPVEGNVSPTGAA